MGDTKAIGGITFKLNNPDAKVDFKQGKNGAIIVTGHDASIYLPKNTASNIVVGEDSLFNLASTHDLKIVDGDEDDSGRYSDKISIYNASNVTYTAATETRDGKPFAQDYPEGGDVITVNKGTANQIFAKSGNNVTVGEEAKNTYVQANQGCKILDKTIGLDFTFIDVKALPGIKSPKPVDVISVANVTKVKMDKNTFVIARGPNVHVLDKNLKQIEQSNPIFLNDDRPNVPEEYHQ